MQAMMQIRETKVIYNGDCNVVRRAWQERKRYLAFRTMEMSEVIGNLDRGRAPQRRVVKQNESRRIGARVKARVDHSHNNGLEMMIQCHGKSEDIGIKSEDNEKHVHRLCMESQTNMGGI